MNPSYPRTLLLVGSRPGRGNVGELLVSEMLDAVQSQNLALVSLMPNAAAFSAQHTGTLPSLYLEHPAEGRSVHSRGRILNLVDALNHTVWLKRSVNTLVEEVVRFARQQKIERLWVVLNTPFITALAVEVHRRLKVPLLTHVWDDIEHLTRQRRLDGWTRRSYQRKAGMLMRSSARTAVICEEMASSYTAQYRARCTIVRLGQEAKKDRDPYSVNDNEFVIGYSGSMYSYSAWYAFLQALDELKWTLAGRPVRFVVLSGYVSFRAQVPCNIEFMGWRNDEEVLEVLSKCNLLYLPQPFEEYEQPLTRLSFPTKMSAYSAIGRPIFIHTPTYGSLTAFHKENPVGPISHSLKAQDLAATLIDFAENPQICEAAEKVVKNVASEILSRPAFMSQVRDFLAA